MRRAAVLSGAIKVLLVLEGGMPETVRSFPASLTGSDVDVLTAWAKTLAPPPGRAAGPDATRDNGATSESTNCDT